MLNLPLEPTSENAKPAFADPSSCKQWLGQLQFTNMQSAMTALRNQLNEFNRLPVRGGDRLNTMEILRETVHGAQEDYLKRLAGKLLPFEDAELNILNASAGVWQAMFTGYLRCLESYQQEDKQLAKQGALLCQRAMLYSKLQIFDRLRAGYEFDGAPWQQLHALFAFAEDQGLLTAEVKDEFAAKGSRSTCRNLYVSALLADYARPQELTAAQQKLMDNWIALWSDSFSVDRTYAISKGDALPLAIDLGSTRGLQPISNGMQGEQDHMRYFAMVPVSKLMRVKMILLQQGHTPKQVELGNEVSSGTCLDLLHHLHKQWCEPRQAYTSERLGAMQKVQACYGIEDIYGGCGGLPFTPTKKIAYENWHTEDLNLLGARLIRENPKGERLSTGRILAVRTAEDAPFRLGYLTWVSVTSGGQLHTGVRFFPGDPRAIALKDPKALPGSANRFPAVLLPAMANLGIPASLIMTRNIYTPGQERELEGTIAPGGEKLKFRLKFSVEKGIDYERVSFTEI